MIFKGSTKVHWIRYITSLAMAVNPTDVFAMGQAFGMIRLLETVDNKYLQPGFQHSFKMVKDAPYKYPSYMHLKFANGQERKYDMGVSPFAHIQTEIDYINNAVEFERSYNG